MVEETGPRYVLFNLLIFHRSKANHNHPQGWGQYLQYSFDTSSAFVINDAIAGRSARSYTREGSFAAIAEVIKPGDWVIIEFGHNDGGSPLPSSQDNGRADCEFLIFLIDRIHANSF